MTTEDFAAIRADSSAGQPRTLSELALSELREAILSGEFEPGMRLPLREQVERLQMSNLPVREALNRLAHVGLVERAPHKGARVAPLSLADMEDTYRLRMVLEDLAIRDAAERFTDKDVDECERWLAAYRDAYRHQDWARTRRAHTALHLTVYAAGESRWLLRVIPMLWDNSERYRRLTLDERGDLDAIVAEHRAFVQACAARDADLASRRLADHLHRTMTIVRRGLTERPE